MFILSKQSNFPPNFRYKTFLTKTIKEYITSESNNNKYNKFF